MGIRVVLLPLVQPLQCESLIYRDEAVAVVAADLWSGLWGRDGERGFSAR